MALIQKQPISISDARQFYTFSEGNRKLIVGLGNIGKKYDGTRHNIGFACIDEFAEKQEFDPWVEKKDLHCLMTKKAFDKTEVILCKPTTLMNLSGQAVQAISHFYKIPVESIVVVHDDMDVAFGQLRMKVGGSDAGNKGIKSVSEQLGPDFGRVRIGVGRSDDIEAKDYVLQKFTSEEQGKLDLLTREVASILTEFVYGKTLPTDTRNFLL